MCVIPFDRIKLYRMVHIDNIPHILQYGITRATSKYCNPDYVSIGDLSLIKNRKQTVLSVKGKNINIGDFIPFYFWLKMPMLYVIQHGYNNTKQIDTEDIVYIVVSLKDLIKTDKNYYFTDGHAKDKLTKTFDNSDINNIENLLDWKSIRAEQWSGDGIDTEVKRKKQAEFLYSDDITPDYIVGYACSNENAKAKLVSFGVKQDLIKILPKFYYENDSIS